jgi:hypothetical protein
MTYQQVPTKFEAEQFTGSNFDAFVAAVDPENLHSVTLNDDGTVSYYGPAGQFLINPGDWLISQGYTGTFAGWNAYGGAGNVRPDDQFQTQFVAV